MAKQYPGQVQCIFLRNTSSTDPSDNFPYNTAGFQGLNQSQYMFFNVPDDLTNLDIAGGYCYNSSVKQNLTFSYQGLPFGLSKSNSSSSSPSSSGAMGTFNLGGSRLSMVASALLAVVGISAFGGL
jgi:hypothetical protein